MWDKSHQTGTLRTDSNDRDWGTICCRGEEVLVQGIIRLEMQACRRINVLLCKTNMVLADLWSQHKPFVVIYAYRAEVCVYSAANNSLQNVHFRVCTSHLSQAHLYKSLYKADSDLLQLLTPQTHLTTMVRRMHAMVRSHTFIFKILHLSFYCPIRI